MEEEIPFFATPDSGFITAYQAPIAIPKAVLLANDSGPDLFFFDARDPEHGTLEWHADTVIFQPDRGYSGPAEFTYYIWGGNGGIDAARVYLTVGSPSYGTLADEFIVGSAAANKLIGRGGNDILLGLGGDDRLYGGDNEDRIIGGDGNDVLFGDNPNGGNNAEGFADTFVFDADDGADKVFDFEAGLDKIELSDGDGYWLEYGPSGNTFLHYGQTTVTFYDAIVTAGDIIEV